MLIKFCGVGLSPRLLLLLAIFGWSSRADNAVAVGVKEVIPPIKYTSEGFIHFKQISDRGESLIIGTKPETAYGDSSTLLECSKHDCNIPDYYKDTYHLNVVKDIPGGNEEAKKAKLSDYFYVINKESWSCHLHGDTTKGFLMIVNEYVGIQELFEIKYYDGIEVSLAYTTDAIRTARVREVKYINVKHPSEAFRYEGTLYYKDKGKVTDSIPNHYGTLIETNIQKNEVEVGKGKKEVLVRDMTFQDTSSYRLVEIPDSKQGKTLMIGSPWTKEFGDENFISACFPSQGLKYFPFEFRPTVYDLFEVTGSETISALLTEEFFSQFFVSIREEIWECIPVEGDNFLRIVNEVVGRKEVRNVYFSDGITHIYNIYMDDGSGTEEHDAPKTIRFREVKYLNPVTKEVLKYKGSLKFVEPKSNVKENNIPFKLNSNRLYQVQINAKGYDLRVGSRWENKIGDANSFVQCAQPSSSSPYIKAFNTKIRVKTVVEDGDMRTHGVEHIRKYSKADYFQFTKEEYSICQGTTEDTDVKIRFLRVLNEIKVRVPIRQIEFYDGVEIFEQSIIRTEKSVQIREIKYLHDENLEVLKYEGRLEFHRGASSGITRLPGWQAVEVNNEDTVWRVGHFTGKKHELIERTYSLNSEQKWYYIKTYNHQRPPYYILQIGKFPTSSIGKKDDTIICRKSDERDKTSTEVFSYRGERDTVPNTERADSYLTHTKDEVWNCDSVDKNLQIKRFMNRFFINKDTPKPVKDVRFFDSQEPWYVVCNHPDGFQIEMEEILYKQGNFLRKFEGYTVLDEGDDEKGVKMSGTVIFEDKKENFDRNLDYTMVDIEYHTDRETEYHETYLNKEGETNLQIGSKWKRIFGNATTVMVCALYNSCHRGIYDTYFRTRVKIEGEDIHNQLLFQNYFDDLKTEVWKCIDKDNPESQHSRFLRIKTQFSIKPHHCPKIGKLWHWDGVTIMKGDYVRGTPGCHEIAEVKYLDPIDYTPLRFDGKVQLVNVENKAVPKQILAVRLVDVAKIEVHIQPVPHMKNKLFKSVVNRKGLTIEIGCPHQTVISIPEPMCKHQDRMLDRDKVRYLPEVRLNPDQKSGSTGPIKMSATQLHLCFEILTSEIWKCQAVNREFIRAIHRIKMKPDCPIARIYYHNGVTVDVKPEVIIKEVKYMTLEGEIVRFEGFINVVQQYHHSLGEEDTTGIESREIVYELDTPSLLFTKIQNKGVILEVGSQWEEEFGSADDSVFCRRKMDHKTDPKYNTKVYSNLKGLDEKDMLVDLNEGGMFYEYFTVLKQELWNCQMNKDEAFLRVVNYNVALKEIAVLYHPDGITIGTQVFPDKSVSKQIKEVKYLHPENKRVQRYNGEITLETISSLRDTKLFQMPHPLLKLEVDEDQEEAGAKGAGKKGENYEMTGAKDQDQKTWSVDILRVHALRMKKQFESGGFPNPDVAEPVQYTKGNINVTRISEGYDVKMKVGSQWDRELKTQGDSMSCILDQWNPTSGRKLLTKVQLYFDNDKYELNYDTIYEYFIIKNIEVWICVNDHDTLLRVVTTLEGVSGIFVVLHRDGVKVTPLDLPAGGKSAKIVETKYIDPVDFKILKYTGQLKLLTSSTDEEKKEQVILEPDWKKEIANVFKKWKNKLMEWYNWVKGTVGDVVVTVARAVGIE